MRTKIDDRDDALVLLTDTIGFNLGNRYEILTPHVIGAVRVVWALRFHSTSILVYKRMSQLLTSISIYVTTRSDGSGRSNV